MGGIFPRLPEIQRSLGVAEGGFGLALIGTASGTLVSLSFAGPLLRRLGHRNALLGLTALLPAFYWIASHARGPAMFFALLVPAGLCIGGVEIIVNLEADRVEHQTGQRLMNRAHGFWSVGFFVAGTLGAGMSQWGVSPPAHLALAMLAVWVGLAVLLGRFEAAPHRTTRHAAPPVRFARPTRGLMLLVVVALSATVMEGAAADWSAIYMRDVFQAAPFLAGVAVAVGPMVQAAVRFLADGLLEKHRPVRLARLMLTVLGAGSLLVFAAPTGWAALLGLGLMGAGTATIFPMAMSAAAQRTDRAPETNVAALAQISFVAFLLGPPLLGLLAQDVGIRWSFGVGVPLVLASIVAAGALRSR